MLRPFLRNASAGLALMLLAVSPLSPAPREIAALRGALLDLPGPAGRASGAEAVHLLVPQLPGLAPQEAVPVFARGGEVYVPISFLRQAGFQESGQAVMKGGVPFAALSSVRGLSGGMAVEEGVLDLACAGACFGETRLSLAGEARAVQPLGGAGGFFNYDALLQTGDPGTGWGVFGEAGIFAGPGTGVFSFTCGRGMDGARCLRLESSIVHDDPSLMTRLVLGDALTQPGLSGAPLRFGGVKWGTDFSLRPGFVTFPVPDFAGTAELPSTVDLFINGTRRTRADVPAGPFAVEDLPVLQGAGEAQLVLRDTLGRERVITADYYASPSLLKPGLDDFSLEAGFLREDYAVSSNQYGEAFAGGLYRRGISDWLTAELRGAAGEAGPSGGLGFSLAHPFFGAATMGVAASRRGGEIGFLGHAAYEWRASPFSVALGAEIAEPQFRRLGGRADRDFARSTLRGQLSLASLRGESLALSWLSRDEREGEQGVPRPDFESLGVSLSGPLGAGFYRLSVQRYLAPEDEVFAGVSFSFPLGEGRSAGAAFEQDEDAFGWDLRFRQDAPTDGGVGAYARLGHETEGRQEAGLDYRTSIGDFGIAGARFAGASALRLSARGAFVTAGGAAALARPVTDGFAIIDVGGEENVGIYQDGRLAGHTDAGGQFVLTSLRAYDENRLSFDPRDLPLRASFGAAEQTLVPRYRAGYRIAFKAEENSGAVLRLLDEEGKPFPEGALIRLQGREAALPVGAGGKVYLTSLPPGPALHFQTGEGVCAVRLPVQEAPLPEAPYRDFGTLACRSKGEGL